MKVEFERDSVPVQLESFDGDHITRVMQRTHDFFESEVLTAIGDLQPTGTVLDIGAFIGTHTVYLGLFTGARDIIAVEPNPPALELLRSNVAGNGLANRVEVVDCAVGDTESEVGIRPGKSFNRGHTVIKEGSGIRQRRTDDIAGDREVSVLKIDTEGYELRVINGAAKLLTNQSPVIFAEARTRRSKKALDDALSVFGYKPAVSFNHRSWVHSYKK